MPADEPIRIELRRLLALVIGAEAAREPFSSTLTQAGIDSLSILEICEALGDHFEVYLDDSTIDNLTTLDDIVRAVQQASPPDLVPQEDSTVEDANPAEEGDPEAGHDSDAVEPSTLLVSAVAVLGIIVSIMIGYNGAEPRWADDPTSQSEPLVDGSDSGSEPSAEPGAGTLSASSTSISPGETLTLSGSLDVPAGTKLTVQRREGGNWVDFPVSATSKGSEFSLSIRTSRTGDQEFRISAATGQVTESVLITIR